MAVKSNEIYQRRKPLKLILKIFFSLIALVILLVVIIFFWFQSYIVYTSDGVRLDIPFLNRGVVTESSQPGPGN